MFQQDYGYMAHQTGQFIQAGSYAAQPAPAAGHPPHFQIPTPKPKIDKPIKATEIKSYLHAWCTKRAEKPEYTYTSTGKPPKVRYQCKLTIPSIGNSLTHEATSKKAAQTNVAWSYIDILIQKGLVNQAELPPRPVVTPVPTVTEQPTGIPVDVAKYGGWSTENARQRLNRFCVQQGLTCNIVNQVGGTPQQKITTASLSLKVDDKELCASAKSTNKKSANAQCSLEMIALLIEMKLIGTKEEEQAENQKPVKRKVDEVDEHGNWNLTNSLQRMKEFASEMATVEGFSNVITANLDNATMKYKGKCHTFCFGFEFLSEAEGNTEDEVHRQVSFQNISKLFKAGLILAKKNETYKNAKRAKESINFEERKTHIRQTDHIMLPRWGSGRMTPWDDRHIKSKLIELEHTLDEKTALRDMSIFVEGLLKKASDDLETKYNKKENQHYVDIPENRILVGVMRIGDFAKGLLLKDEMELDLCVSCRDKPTLNMINEVAELLRKHSKSEDGNVISENDTFEIQCNPDKASIFTTKIFNGFKINVIINFTSQRFNAELDDLPEAERVPDPEDMLPKDLCMRNLIESRRTGFFISTAPRLLNCICICRIVKDMVRRDSDWECLKGWPMALTIIKSLGTIGMPETAGDCLRRFMSTIAGGTFLPNGAGLLSVVEKERDLIGDWTQQQREFITFKAQTNLRLLSFRKIHLVLGIDMIPNPRKQQKVAEQPKEVKDEPMNADG